MWGGKHPQAPVAVAQKTHYFCELNVPATMDNFLEQCPQFWESAELRESLAEGHVLGMAPGFWAQVRFVCWGGPCGMYCLAGNGRAVQAEPADGAVHGPALALALRLPSRC